MDKIIKLYGWNYFLEESHFYFQYKGEEGLVVNCH